MPRPGEVIQNPITGETIRFLRTFAEGGDGALRERLVLPGYPHEARPHLHATLTETFEVLEGEARYRLGEQEAPLGPGDAIEMPAGVPHVHPWNAGPTPLRMRQAVRLHGGDVAGAAAVEDYLAATFALAAAGRCRPDGRPPLLQVAVSLQAAFPHVMLAGIPPWLQRGMIALLAPLGRAAGYRARPPVPEAVSPNPPST